MQAEAEFPAKLRGLFVPNRYKILYGGRGGAKSWGISRALLIQSAQRPLRVGCFREIQKSIADSVHQLLTDQIAKLNLGYYFKVQEKSITGVAGTATGTQFSFDGLRHNVDNIKSKEGLDRAWISEATKVSANSWEKLVPTIRKDDSEIWVDLNPELAEDETYRRFVTAPPAGAWVQKVNWSDNPWFPRVLELERLALQARDPDAYLNVWEGHCRLTLDGAIFAAELREAQQEGRITRVPYQSGKPVHTFWDLGRADNTTIWFAQWAGLGEIKVIDYYQDNQKALSHYLQVLQSRGYVYGTHWLPHDAENEHLVADKTIAGQMRAVYPSVRIVPKMGVTVGINAARTVFPNVWFDEKKCVDGLQCLRHYRYDVDPDTRQFSDRPLHDWASHGADAFRYMAVAIREPKKPTTKAKQQTNHAAGWMGA